MVGTIIGWVVFGLIVGLIARALVPGRDDIGILRTIVLGVVGSVAGGLLVRLFTGGFDQFRLPDLGQVQSGELIDFFQPAGWIGSVIGAIVVLVIYNKVTGRKRLRR